MPVDYTLDGGLLRMDLVGQYGPADITRAFLDALGDPRCPEQVALLLDTTRSEALSQRSTLEIRRVAEFLGPHRERIRGKCAVLVGSELHYGLGRVGSAYSELVGVEARVFWKLSTALQWLGVDAAADSHP